MIPATRQHVLSHGGLDQSRALAMLTEVGWGYSGVAASAHRHWVRNVRGRVFENLRAHGFIWEEIRVSCKATGRYRITGYQPGVAEICEILGKIYWANGRYNSSGWERRVEQAWRYATELEAEPGVLEVVISIGPNWRGTFDELVEAARLVTA